MSDYSEKPEYRKRPVHFHERIHELQKEGRSIPDVVPYPGDPTGLRLVVRNQLIVHLENSIVRQSRELRVIGEDISRGRSKRGLIAKVIAVCRCNPNLILLEGEQGEEAHLLTGDIEIRYSPDTDQPPPKVKNSSANDVRYSPDTDQPPPKVKNSSSGDGTPVAIAPASFDFQLRRILAGSASWSTYPIVAVMDTGIDFAYPNVESIPIQHNGGHPMCGSIELDYIGWDFVHDQNNPFDDDEHNKHGTRIAAIISTVLDHKVRILPLKVIDSEGFGSLFNIFCGFEYILSGQLQEKPNVINASWGFYDGKENSLMTDYMTRLEKEQIWLVNAAGNRGDIKSGSTVDLGIDNRYPACYSNRHANVVTVTTVRKNPRNKFLVEENYSSTFVNVGIVSGTDGKFKEPLTNGVGLPRVKGSSYAAPYVSAFAAAQSLLPNDELTRQNLLMAMPNLEVDNPIKQYIEEGLIVPI